MAWNPVYVAYAAEHGRTADEQLAYDRQAHPGAHMMEFILWVERRMGKA